MTQQTGTTKEDASKAEIFIKPFPRQQRLIDTLATEVLFGGASEGGKSVAIRLAVILWCSFIPGLQVEIYRKFYKDVIKNHMTGELSFKFLLAEWVKKKIITITENQVRWEKTGSLITLGQLRTEEDAEKAQGIAKHILVIDEATQIKKKHIQDVRGWVRMSKTMTAMLPVYLKDLYYFYTPEQIMGMFPRIIHSGNPIGTSVGYFRRQFVLPHPNETIFRAVDEEGGFLRQFLPSRIDDNPAADKEAQRRRLSGFGVKVAKALIEGDWTAPGGDFYPEWDEERHVISSFRVPKYWFKFRTLDLGYAEPTVCLWWCVSDGEEFEDQQGRLRWFPRGALICYREWNICDIEEPEKGLRLRNKDIALGILQRTPEATSGITLTDSLPFQDRGMGEKKNVRKIKDEFADEGVLLRKANTARIHGWSLLRDRLIGVPIAEGCNIAMIYFFENCEACREYIPMLTYSEREENQEDAQDHGEATHTCDAVRYACTALPPVMAQKRVTKEDLQREAEQNIMTFAGARKSVRKARRRGTK